jgi:prephenate dehydrogenase
LAADFRRIAIVGCGLIGGSIELAARTLQPSPDVVGLDRGDDLSALAGADLVVLSAPILEILQTLPRLRTYLSPDTLVTDTGSTKAAIVEAAGDLRFVGGHPIAGAAASGRAAARADLFSGHAWILTPTATTDPDDVARLRAFVERLGAHVRVLDPDEHDRIFALVSHLPQLVVSAMMNVVGPRAGAEGLELAGAGLRDSTRLASSAPAIWRDIVSSNRNNIRNAIDALIGDLTALRDDESGELLHQTFDAAARWKQALDDRSI